MKYKAGISILGPIFINIFYWNAAMPILLLAVYGCFCAEVAKRNWHKKPNIFTYPYYKRWKESNGHI